MSQISSKQLPNAPRPTITDLSGGRGVLDRTARLSMRTQTYTARTVTECLQMAKQDLGIEAMIVSKKTFRQGALFGRWGGREMVEVTFGTYRPVPAGGSNSILFSHGAANGTADAENPANDTISKLEAQIAGLTESVQNLMEKGPAKQKANAVETFVPAPYEARTIGGDVAQPQREAAPKSPRRSRAKAPAETSEPSSPYPLLMQQMLDTEVAAPLARQLLNDVPPGLSAAEAASSLRTAIAHRLQIANRVRPDVGGGMKLLAFIGTTGVGKTTTIAKLAAQYSIMERRKVGVITLDTHRVAAVQQLQTFGQILKVPVQVAHDRDELMQHLNDYKSQGMDLVLVDTAGRSPNDMMPLGEVCDLLDGMGSVHKYLAIPATLAARDMENIVTRFQGILNPDALILTKLDEATDNSCFGKMLSIQAKTGLPLAYVTTGQRVPDDITFPDAHAIAARILTTVPL
jgi:flagellar biosynthesis protein FlhF